MLTNVLNIRDLIYSNILFGACLLTVELDAMTLSELLESHQLYGRYIKRMNPS